MWANRLGTLATLTLLFLPTIGARGASSQIAGEVFGPGGAPVAGAEVWAAYTSSSIDYLTATEYSVATAITNQHGRFALSVPESGCRGAVLLIARREGLTADWLPVAAGDTGVLMQLGKAGARVHGRVCDADGRGIPHARVMLDLHSAGVDFNNAALTRLDSHPFAGYTDGAGAYVLTDIPVEAASAAVAAAPGYAPGYSSLWEGGRRRPAGDLGTLTLKKEASVSGRVVRNGRSMPGVPVTCGGQRALTNQDGTYAFVGLYAGKYGVTAATEDGLVGTSAGLVELVTGERRQLPDLELAEGAVISGTVRDRATAEPAEGVRISVYCAPIWHDETQSTAAGAYRIRVPAGHVSIRVPGPATPLFEADVAQGETVDAADLLVPPRPVLEHRFPRRGDIALSLRLLPGNETVSAYEPVVAAAELTNTTAREMQIGEAGEFTTRLQVRDEAGRLVAATVRPVMPYDFGFGIPRIAPGQTRRTPLVISALHTFARAGRYTIRIQRRQPYPCSDLLAEAETTLTVEPFDAARLQRRCEQLFGEATKNTKALWSIRHDLVLPYLEKMANLWEPEYSCRALRRLNTPAARQLLEKLAVRDDGVGKAAKDSLAKAPVEVDAWDIETD